MKKLCVLVALAVGSLMFAAPAHAAKVTPSIAIDQPAPYSVGETVTFTSTFDPSLVGGNTLMLVQLGCWRDNQQIFVETLTTDDAATVGFDLEWAPGSGTVSCVAVLMQAKRTATVLATTSFVVSP